MKTQELTLEILAKELAKGGYKTEVCKGFVNCDISKGTTPNRYAVHGVIMRYGRKIVTQNKPNGGFMAAIGE